MNIFEKMSKLDRRWIYLILAVVVTGSLLIEFKVPIRVDKEVRSVYDFVEGLKPGDYVHLAIDYDPGSLAEMHPMTYAIMEQLLAKDVRVIITALSQNGPTMVDESMHQIMDSLKIHYHKEIVYGRDIVFLGYKPYPGIVILGMGQNYRLPFPGDYYNTPLDSIPMMRGIINYDQVKGIILITSTSGIDYWISYANGRYKAKLAAGVTGVMAADYYPFLGSGQLFGLMSGMLGAAQYETLVKRPGDATDAMRSQVWAHMIIILFIVIGNVGYFISRRRGGTRP